MTGSVGLPKLRDIVKELAKFGRVSAERVEEFCFAGGVEKIEAVKSGMTCLGVVTNISAFGAFVDIEVHQDSLVHVSELADRFVRDPKDVVKVHQKVTVTLRVVDASASASCSP